MRHQLMFYLSLQTVGKRTDTSIGEMVQCRRKHLLKRSYKSILFTFTNGINQLEERERLVIELYYYKGLELRESGEEMGVTESHVCQIRAAAIRNLRENFDSGLILK